MSESNKPNPADREEELVAENAGADAPKGEVGEGVSRVKADKK